MEIKKLIPSFLMALILISDEILKELKIRH